MTVHILNGRKFPFDRQVIVFRECPIDGRLDTANLEVFWKTRADHISKSFDTTPVKYGNHVVKELRKLHGVHRMKSAFDSKESLWRRKRFMTLPIHRWNKC
jgi:hypothetical protein